MSDFNKFRTTLEEKKGLWDNIHAKRKRGEKMRKPGEEGAPTDQDFKNAQKKESVDEKKLTPAELKKREEIAKAMERDNPDMDMSKKMAIATAQAKKVAEGKMSPLSRIKKSGVVKSGSMSKGNDSKPSPEEVAAYRASISPKKEGLDITEISLDMLTKKISNSGMATTKKANKMDKTKKDLAAMRAKLAGDKGMKLAKEAYEDEEPASPDEASMAMRQLGFIEYAAEEVMDHIKSGKEFPEWMQNKLSKLHGQMESLHSALGDHGEDEEENDDDEMKEAADIEEAKRKGAPKMTGDSFAMQRAKDAALNKALDRTKTGRKKPERAMTSTQRSLASLRNEGINTADRKPEKFVKPDGKVGIRMVPVDKQVVDKDA